MSLSGSLSCALDDSVASTDASAGLSLQDIIGTATDAADNMDNMIEWDNSDTDAFLESILTGNPDVEKLALDSGAGLEVPEKPFSDTSSDSGYSQLEHMVTSPTDFIMNANQDLLASAVSPVSIRMDDDDESFPAVNPVTNSPPECTTITIPKAGISVPIVTQPVTVQKSKNLLQTVKTTIVLPKMNTRQKKPSIVCTPTAATVAPPASKRRRVSASSSDSGLEDGSSTSSSSSNSATITSLRSSVSSSPSSLQQKYPPLVLTDEEKRLCERENIKLPSHYPLSKEEEKNLKRIRRKIRNKVSAQDSRKRKKEYVDAMEDRVRICSEENEELHKKIEMLESQNKTLAGQLKRLHQIFLNGGMMKGSQTSTAMMVLLLSTALFLLPGFNKDQASSSSSESKCEIDITQAIKMPPMPGQSRSLLQFSPTGAAPASPVVKEVPDASAAPAQVVVHEMRKGVSTDHDYILIKTEPDLGHVAAPQKSVLFVGGGASQQLKHEIDTSDNGGDDDNDNDDQAAAAGSYIEEDAPPQGYGPRKVLVEERRINVTRGARQGMRTVVLHVPKDIK